MTTDKLWMKFIHEVLDQLETDVSKLALDSERMSLQNVSQKIIMDHVREARRMINDKLEEGYWND